MKLTFVTEENMILISGIKDSMHVSALQCYSSFYPISKKIKIEIYINVINIEVFLGWSKAKF